ncbi:MAG: hypothetical protein U0V70_01660 [Terriglobia bacterium]
MMTPPIGKRVELISMDPHCVDITIGLYLQDHGRGPEYLVHTYSQRTEAKARLDFISQGMVVLGGMEFLQGGNRRLRFSCGGEHLKACRRLFLEVCKFPNGAALTPKDLQIFDKKSNRAIRVVSGPEGSYQVQADGPDDPEKSARIAAIAQGLVKLSEVQMEGTGLGQLSFPCHQRHDPVLGLLLGRALNVRAVMREQELAASRGILAAPSAQNQSMNP